MPTNPIGKGTKNVTVNLPDDLDSDLRELAKQSKMPYGRYLRAVLEEARREKILYEERIERLRSQDKK